MGRNNQKLTRQRLLADIVLVLAVFLLPWWFSALLAVAALLYFETFFEIIFLGLMVDALYRITAPGFWHVELTATVFATVFFIVSLYAKKRLAFFSK